METTISTAFTQRGWSNVTHGVSICNAYAYSVMKSKVEYMRFSSDGGMLIIGSINISLSGLFLPWKYSCMKPFQLGWFSSLLNRKDDYQRISIPELLDTKGCISCITGLRVILDSPHSSSDSYHLTGKFFSSVTFVAFNKDLSPSMRTDSDCSCFCVLVPTAIIPIPLKVYLAIHFTCNHWMLIMGNLLITYGKSKMR